jgi:hypothetical protein
MFRFMINNTNPRDTPNLYTIHDMSKDCKHTSPKLGWKLLGKFNNYKEAQDVASEHYPSAELCPYCCKA